MAHRIGFPTEEGGRGVAAVALGAIVVITVAWWMLALYPVSTEAPEWLVRTRLACFGARDNGLPHAGGWILLVGEPIGMVGTLMAVWGDALRRDLRWLAQRPWGRLIMAGTVGTMLVGSLTAARRIARAVEGADGRATDGIVVPVPAERRRPAQGLTLVDQRGAPFALEALRGRPAIVTFAFGHCETMCPTLVRDVLAARARAGADVPVVVVTVDPWRDVPERLGTIAAAWSLGAGDRLLGGRVEDVMAVLTAWGVSIVRDARTGDVAHPGIAVLVDPLGRESARLHGDMRPLASLLQAER